MKETNTYLKLKNKPQDNFPEYIVVHHSAASEDQTVKSIEDYHLSLGWEGVGYQYLIEKDGTIWKGRPELYHGAHVAEEHINFKSTGICVIGNFDVKLPTKEQEEASKRLVASIVAHYSIPLNKIVSHRYFLGIPPYKSCYGKNLPDDWARKLVEVSEPDYKEKIKNIIQELKSLL